MHLEVESTDFISQNIHISPLRLICKGLLADALTRDCSPIDARVSIDEIFILANHSSTNRNASPEVENVQNVISRSRRKELHPPENYESRFHILKHTDFVVSDGGEIRFRKPLSPADNAEILVKFDTINSIDLEFTGFDSVQDQQALQDEIRSCSWGRYFDGVSTLDSSTVSALTSEDPMVLAEVELSSDIDENIIEVHKASTIYELRERDSDRESSSKKTNKQTVYTDPEITRIRRQRANLIHKILLQKLQDYLEERGIKPLENEHIDLFAKLPSDHKYLFEVKSTNENNLLSQARKGLSQLYEYRYRYQDEVGYDVHLCLVFPEEPDAIPWLQEYLCNDRAISVIWFDPDQEIQHSNSCTESIKPLIVA